MVPHLHMLEHVCVMPPSSWCMLLIPGPFTGVWFDLEGSGPDSADAAEVYAQVRVGCAEWWVEVCAAGATRCLLLAPAITAAEAYRHLCCT